VFISYNFQHFVLSEQKSEQLFIFFTNDIIFIADQPNKFKIIIYISNILVGLSIFFSQIYVIQDTNCINNTKDSETSITMLICLSMISTFSLCFLHMIINK
jgi:hypothetical protein